MNRPAKILETTVIELKRQSNMKCDCGKVGRTEIAEDILAFSTVVEIIGMFRMLFYLDY